MLTIQINKPIWLSKQNTETDGFLYIELFIYFYMIFLFWKEKGDKELQMQYKKNGENNGETTIGCEKVFINCIFYQP